MAQNSQPSKSKWGVGSLFQQAVAGVESRLDHILLDEEDRQKLQSQSPNEKPLETLSTAPISRSPAGSISRSSSNARRGDRLQERLARAVVKSNTANRNLQPSHSRASSQGATSIQSDDARSSMDIDHGPVAPISAIDIPSPPLEEEHSILEAYTPRSSHDSGLSARKSTEISVAGSLPKTFSDSDDQPLNIEGDHQSSLDSQQMEDSEARASVDDTHISVDLPSEAGIDTVIESQHQEEIHGYIERIDALQSKLKYLSKEASESSRNAAATASPGSNKKLLLEKDEKIALLLEEGQKLSKSEMDHRMVVKKLRQQLNENMKSQIESKKRTEKLERDFAIAEARAKRAEAAGKRATESLNSRAKASKDLEVVTNERNALSHTVQEMKGQLSRALARAESAEANAQYDALEQAKHRADELEEELSSIKIEQDISERKAKREIDELKEKAEEEKERARRLEAELKVEQSVLESKMENLRSRAEEAFSGVTGETHAKLLRQVETLQTQYSVASENWRALEGSMLSQISNLEKERDDTVSREADLRKKIRELNLRTRNMEERFETANETEQELEGKIYELEQELQKTQQKLEKATEELSATQSDFAEQKKSCDAAWAQKLEEERAKWREQVNNLPQTRGVSPVQSLRRSSNLDTIGLMESRPMSRRSSTLPSASPDIGTPPRQNSYSSLAQGTLSPPPIITTAHPASILEAPSTAFEPDEFFGSSTHATPSAYGGTQAPQPRGINDIISESTVGAGPSVQLVERMSATVRRLESERAGSKDELARVTTQRDESRQQVVDLMREMDEKQVSSARVQELEAKLADLDQRYQTTLEMLGEKSEQVDELHADIADLKKIYRELVDSTMK